MKRRPSRSTLNRVTRLTLRVALAGALVTLLGALWLTHSRSGRQLLASAATRAVDGAIAGRVALEELAGLELYGSLGGQLRLRLELRGLELRDPSGARVARLERLELCWQPLALLWRELRIDLLSVAGLELDLRHHDEPERGLSSALAPTEAGDEAAPQAAWDVYVARVSLNARRLALARSTTFGETELRALQLEGSLHVERGQLQAELTRGEAQWVRSDGRPLLQLDALRARWPRPREQFEVALALRTAAAELRGRVSGAVPNADDWLAQPLDVQLRLDNVHPVVLSDHWGIDLPLPALRGPWELSFSGQGSAANARGMVTMQTPAGELTLPWALNDRLLRWNLQTSSFEPSRLLARGELPRPLHIEADIAGDLRLPSEASAPIPVSLRARSSLNGQLLPALQASAKLQTDGVRDLRLKLKDGASELSLSGDLPQNGERRADLTWQLDAATVARLLAAFGQPSPLTNGRLSGSLALRQSAAWTLTGTISGSRFRAGPLALDALDAELDLALRWTEQQLPWPSGRAGLRLAGLVLPGTPHVIRRASVTAHGDESRYRLRAAFDAGEAAIGRAALTLTPRASGAVDVSGHASGKLFTQELQISLKPTTLTTSAQRPPARAQRARDGGLALNTRGLVLTLAGQRASLAGSFGPRAIDVRLRAQQLELARLQELLSAFGVAAEQEVSLDGALSLDAHITGRPQRPIVQGQLSLADLAARRADGRRSPQLDAEARVDLRAPTGQARAELTLTSSGRTTTQRDAALRVTLASQFSAAGTWHEQLAEGAHQVRVELEHLDSRWLEAWLGESMPVRARLRGSADLAWTETPRLSSQFTLDVEEAPGRTTWRIRPSLEYDGREARLHVEVADAAGSLLQANGDLQAPLTRDALLALGAEWPSLLQHGYRLELAVPSRELRALPFVHQLLDPSLPPLMVQLRAHVEQQPRGEPQLDVRLLTQQLGASEPVAGCSTERLGALVHISAEAGQLRARLDAARGTRRLAQLDLQTPFSLHALLAGQAPDWDRQHLTARVRQLPLSSLPIVCRHASGTLSLDAALDAPLGSTPSARAQLRLQDATLARAPLDVDARLEATTAGVQLQAQVSDTTNPQHTSHLKASTRWSWKAGQIELSPSAPLSVSAKLARLPLAPLIPRASGLSHVAGTVDGRLELNGSLLLPELAGELELNDVALTFTDLAQPLHDIRGRVVFSDRDVRVERWVAKDGAGVLQVDARARLDGTRRAQGTARIQLKEFPLRQNGQIAATVTGALGLSAEQRPTATQVRLRIDELDTYLESYQQRGGLALTPHPDVIVDGKPLRQTSGASDTPPALQRSASNASPASPASNASPASPASNASPASPASNASPTSPASNNTSASSPASNNTSAASSAPDAVARSTHIDIRSSERFWIKRDDFALRLMAALQMDLTPSGAQIGGEVTIDRGYIDLFGKVFDVDPAGSSLRFTRTAVPDPVVRLSASHQNRRTGDAITVVVSGRASAPVVQFRVNGREVEAGAAVAAIYGSSHSSNTQASAKAQAASILAGVTAGLLATTARRELGGLTPILMIEAGDGEQQARVRAGFEFDSLVPELLRDVVTGVYFEGIIATESSQAAAGRSTRRSGAGALLELYFPHRVFTSGQYGPGTSWSLDLGWQL